MDIVDQLKARHQQARERGGDMMTYGDGDPLAVAAAAEIERLRGIISRANLRENTELRDLAPNR